MIIIIASQICIAIVFRFMSYTSRNYPAQINTIAILLTEHLTDNFSDEMFNHAEYTQLLQKISDAWGVDIWLEYENGEPLASNTWKMRPSFENNTKNYDVFGVQINHNFPPFNELIIRSENSKYIFYVQRIQDGLLFRDFHFILALAIVTLLTAFLLWPVSRRITKPLKELTESANAITKGEFNLRVHEKSNDEVGELAKAFNIMSERVLQMIDGTKKLTANISHQIYSPLTRLSVSVDILREKISTTDKKELKEQNELFTSIVHEIEAMVVLTQKIITFIRIDTVHKSSEYEDISLTDVASETATKFGKLIKQKNINYSYVYSKIPIIIKGVAGDINELFDIFYDNAIRYSLEKGKVICSITEKDNEIKIEMKNKATPLPENAVDSIFEPFQRFVSEKISGNGLGLAIAKGIVENHGGTVSAESDEKNFTITVVFKKDIN